MITSEGDDEVMSKDKLLDGQSVSIVCPKCAPMVKLIIRTNRANGSQFLGCPNFPQCTFTRELPIDLVMRSLGATMLPGFE